MEDKGHSGPPPYDGQTFPPQPGFNYSSPSYPPPAFNMENYPSSPPAPVIHQPVTSVTIQGGGAMIPGSCPVCHAKSWSTSYTCCGILCCIFCFPIGIICCCLWRGKKCSKCGFKTN